MKLLPKLQTHKTNYRYQVGNNRHEEPNRDNSTETCCSAMLVHNWEKNISLLQRHDKRENTHKQPLQRMAIPSTKKFYSSHSSSVRKATWNLHSASHVTFSKHPGTILKNELCWTILGFRNPCLSLSLEIHRHFCCHGRVLPFLKTQPGQAEWLWPKPTGYPEPWEKGAGI